jgi:hypothetical protein
MANGLNQSRGLRYYVRDVQSGCFFNEGAWASDVSDAQEFRTEEDAILFLKENPDKHLEIVIRY